MPLFVKRRWLRLSFIGLVLFAAVAVILANTVLRDPRPPSSREFAAIREDWERTVYGHALEGNLLTLLKDRYAKRLTEAEKRAKLVQLSERCLEHAEKHPNTTG